MEPLRPNTASNRCTETPNSNCVKYVGTTIPCIPNCNGDTVSDVLYKLGQKECWLESKLDFSSLTYPSCCYTPCPSCQNPSELVDILQIAFNCIAAQCARITALEADVAILKAGVSP